MNQIWFHDIQVINEAYNNIHKVGRKYRTLVENDNENEIDHYDSEYPIPQDELFNKKLMCWVRK